MAHVQFTVEDWLSAPEDGRLYEILDGRLTVNPPPDWIHQLHVKRIFRVLDHQYERTGRALVFFAPTGVKLSDTDVPEPDILLYLAQRKAEVLADRRYLQGPPDLVVEVLSPGTERTDRGLKSKTYARHGVREYWLVDIERSCIEVLVLDETGFRPAGSHGPGTKVASEVLPDLDLDVTDLFAPP